MCDRDGRQSTAVCGFVAEILPEQRALGGAILNL
jgi:hypothetical protein